MAKILTPKERRSLDGSSAGSATSRGKRSNTSPPVLKMETAERLSDDADDALSYSERDSPDAGDFYDEPEMRRNDYHRPKKRLKLKESGVVATRVEEYLVEAQKLPVQDQAESDEYFNTFLFHDDPFHREQTDAALSANRTPKDWLDLFFTETVYEMIECKANWELYGGCSKKARSFVAILLQMGSVKAPRLYSYWKDRFFQAPFWAKTLPFDDFLTVLGYEDEEDYSKTFVEAMNGPLEEYCHPKMNAQSRCWRGRVAIRRYWDKTRTRMLASLFVLMEPDGLVLKFHTVGEDDPRETSVDSITELLKKGNGFGKLLNKTDVYAGVELVRYFHDVDKSLTTDPGCANWKFLNVEAKLISREENAVTEEMLLINLIPAKDCVEESNPNDVFGFSIDFGHRCFHWPRLAGYTRVIVDVIGLTINAAFILHARHNLIAQQDCSLLDFRHDSLKLLLEDLRQDSRVVPQPTSSLAVLAEASKSLQTISVLGQDYLTSSAVSRKNSVEMAVLAETDPNQLNNHGLVLISEDKPNLRRRCRRCYKMGRRRESRLKCSMCPGMVLCVECQPYHAAEFS